MMYYDVEGQRPCLFNSIFSDSIAECKKRHHDRSAIFACLYVYLNIEANSFIGSRSFTVVRYTIKKITSKCHQSSVGLSKFRSGNCIV